MKKLPLFGFLIIIVASLSFNCHKEVTKDENMHGDISPSTAKIEGEIVSIEPVGDKNTGPCSSYPCVAVVKLKSIEYGAAFPVLSVGKEYRIKFSYTLGKTTKEMFPDLDKPLPGLRTGDSFIAMVSHSLQMEGSKQPEFEISSYTKNN